MGFSVQILTSVTIYYLIKYKGTPTRFHKFIYQFFSFYFVGIITIFHVPLVNVFSILVFCNDLSPFTQNIGTCYSGYMLIHQIAACIVITYIQGITILFFYLFLLSLILNETNFNSNIPYAQPFTFKLFTRIILNMAAPTFRVLDFANESVV